MTITIHHLGIGQSERVIWLCEELGVPYTLKLYRRDPVTILSPPELRAVHPMGAAPVIEDGALVLAESGAVVEYICRRHAGGRLMPGPDAPEFADFLYWFHFSNGNLQPVMGRSLALSRLKLPADNPVQAGQDKRLHKVFEMVEARLAVSDYLAGPELSAADIMAVFSLSTMRHFFPVDLSPYPATRAYLQRIGARPAYQRAMAAGDPGFTPLLS